LLVKSTNIYEHDEFQFYFKHVYRNKLIPGEPRAILYFICYNIWIDRQHDQFVFLPNSKIRVMYLYAYFLKFRFIHLLFFNFSKRFFKQTQSFLISLSAVDNGFLITLLVVSLRHYGFNLFDKYEIVCRFTVFFSFVFCFLSSW
jgi:hypothetical protein